MQKIFIDTSGFKALIDDKDQYHEEVGDIWEKFRSDTHANLVTSNYVLDESYTLLRQRLGFIKAKRLRKLLSENAEIFYVARVTVDDELNAWEWFKRDWKNLSFTDCVTFAMLKRLDIKRVVAFDEHVSWAGFKVEK
jgi:uncharacterized protein